MMYNVGAWQIIMFVLMVLLAVIPFWKLYSRAGFSGAWALLAVIPLAPIVLLWVIAFIRWPDVDRD